VSSGAGSPRRTVHLTLARSESALRACIADTVAADGCDVGRVLASLTGCTDGSARSATAGRGV
jgi:hypothetical protein